MISNHQPDIVAIQESKCLEVDDSLMENMWGSLNFGFIQKPMVGKSGGMFLIWNTDAFSVSEAVEGQFFLVVKGKWLGRDNDTIIVNVYGAHADVDKAKFWDSVKSLMKFENQDWVLCGDFNKVRSFEERENWKGYTRISDDGVLKLSKLDRKLDRFLVIDNFLHSWGELSAITLDRGLSNHCPILLRDGNVDFGPKPFKLFNVWFENIDIEPIIVNAWHKDVSRNRPDCILCDKLKNVQEALRCWSKSQYGEIDCEIDTAKRISSDLETKAESTILSDQERLDWANARNFLLKKEREKAHILKQKAKAKWACEGDENTKFFHLVIKRKLSKSNIRGLHVDDQEQFIQGLDNLNFQRINDNEASGLEAPFHESEIWAAVKNCGSSKASAHDGFNILDLFCMGFGNKWRSWVRECLNTASISVLVNGSPTKEFRLEKWVRQGDPLSPYLFIITSEGLNRLIKRALEFSIFKGVKVGGDNLNVSPLQYADDSIFSKNGANAMHKT
ncbi:uncharacterized protein [Rutidosis leptorrhynchoides]|uniref:uncharacterized protein n=1 Tax=Rutidosis leptorrhynchoides TaxID=125765 RepID=UPI003A998948